MPLTLTDATPCIFNGEKVTFGTIKGVVSIVSAYPQVSSDVAVTHADIVCGVELDGGYETITLPAFVPLRPLLERFNSGLDRIRFAMLQGRFVVVRTSRLDPVDLSDDPDSVADYTDVVLGAIIVTDKKGVPRGCGPSCRAVMAFSLMRTCRRLGRSLNDASSWRALGSYDQCHYFLS